jgi:hypothetical protein
LGKCCSKIALILNPEVSAAQAEGFVSFTSGNCTMKRTFLYITKSHVGADVAQSV